MQLVAYSNNQILTLAHQATKCVDYRCVECGGIVRRRGGIHRRDHFFHVAPSDSCRLNGKSMNHLQVQWAILQNLPSREVVLERRFSEIDRIADVCWEKERLVFEVQCSPISREELLARNQDYRSLGYEIVWILHDHRFNKRRLSAAEFALQESPHYFTNMDVNGNGKIYDQLSVICKGQRVRRFSNFSVDLSLFKKESIGFMLPDQLQVRIKKWGIYFSGDTIDQFLKGNVCEKKFLSFFVDRDINLSRGWLFSVFISLQRFVVDFYQRLFRTILEKMCQ
jgi:competence protein CoiA